MFRDPKPKRVSFENNGALFVAASSSVRRQPDLGPAISSYFQAGQKIVFAEDEPQTSISQCHAVIALHPDMKQLTQLLIDVGATRQARGDGSPVLVIGIAPNQLTTFGDWLSSHAAAGRLSGIRLIVDADPAAILRSAQSMLAPFTEPSTIAMPVSTEVETPRYKYFYCISPSLRELLSTLKELSANNIDRLYLLGGPGAGKTSLAYYFYQFRQRGNFVTVNLTAESTGDKAAMKSLLCGHVSGAFPGAGSRSGAFSHARDGVCFLDESHGVSGSVMEVLMEALDSGQYLPYGASAKRPLDCAIVFASNRTWESLLNQVNLDEHARLGATIVRLADLSARQEDLIAVLADTLARMAEKSVTWSVPAGLTNEAWQLIKQSSWTGNNRSLMRVIETAFVDCAMRGGSMIEHQHVQHGLSLWEPRDHASRALYTSSGTSGIGPNAH